MKKIWSLNNTERGMRKIFHRSRLSAPMSVCGLLLLTTIFLSCHKEKKENQQEDVLFSIDGNSLSLSDVESKIPVGIEPADSASLFDKIVDNWIETAVLAKLAESKLPDLEDIDSKVEAYRNRLIVAEYLRMMEESQRQKVSSDSVRAYYDAHKKELLTESPLVKVIYMKVASSSPGIEEIKELIFRATDDDIDQLEKNWMETALQYDYFGSTWIDWQTLADQIPYRFYDPDAFLQSTDNFETTYNGSTYIFHISDYLPTGSEQPYEFAANEISSMLERSKIGSYEDALVRSLVEKAIKEDRFVIVNYDPLKRSFINKSIKTTNKDTKIDEEI